MLPHTPHNTHDGPSPEGRGPNVTALRGAAEQRGGRRKQARRKNKPGGGSEPEPRDRGEAHGRSEVLPGILYNQGAFHWDSTPSSVLFFLIRQR